MNTPPSSTKVPVGIIDTPSSPTRAFAIFEISAHIVEHTYEREKRKGPVLNTKVLFALTRVNKILSSIALAALWRVVYDPAPLFKLLPTWYMISEPGGSRILKMQNSEKASICLHRYLYYTSFVRKLVLWPVIPQNADALQAASIQADYWKASDLHFPNLRSFCVSPTSFTNFPICFAGIGRSVHHLILMMQETARVLVAIQLLPESKVDLKILYIKNYSLGPAAFQEFVAPALKTQNSLTTLRIELLLSTLVDFFLVLHSLPCLSAVHMHTVCPVDYNAASPLPSRSGLMPKQINTLRGTFLLKEEMDAVIEISSKMLVFFDHIHCVIRLASSPDEIEDALKSLVQLHPLAEGITYDEIDFLTMPEFASSMPTLDDFHTMAKHLLPLSHMRHLKRSRFTLYGTLAVTPELLDKFADGCPSLESCDLSPDK